MQNSTDHQLIQQTLQGELSAFDELVIKYQRPVYTLCLGFLSEPEDARDLAQEVFLKAFEGLRRFRGQSSFRTWIYRIAVNACLNFKRNKRTEHVELCEAHTQMIYHSTASLERSDNLSHALSLMAKLPPKQRTVIILRVEQGLSYDEISEITGQSVAAVKTTMCYALQKIKRMMQRPAKAPLRNLRHSESG
ncbi:MAG: RNA polymerase sigma factor [Acidobacteria bacterium]|nr:RNA polymerase sigma factor [Acidobacteriota bacterium]